MTRHFFLILLSTLTLGGCTNSLARKPIHSYSSRSLPSLKAPLSVALSGSPAIVEVRMVCITSVIDVYADGKREPRAVESCGSSEGRAKMTLVVPWGEAYTVTVDENDIASFPVDWSRSGIDPLDPRSASRIAKGWKLLWGGGGEAALQISDQTAAKMLTAVASSLGVDGSNENRTLPIELRPIELRIVAFEFEPTRVSAGKAVTVRMTLTNKGPGIAYRVRAILSSSLEVAHKKGIAFGKIGVGEFVTRTLNIKTPPSASTGEALVVVSLREANSTPAAMTQKRLTITRSIAAAKIVRKDPPKPPRTVILKCHFEGKAGEQRPELNLERNIQVGCIVRSMVAKTVTSSVSVVVRGPRNKGQTAAKTVKVAPNTIKIVRFKFGVPADLTLGDEIQVKATSNDGGAVTFRGVVGRVGICPGGQITREQYKTKRKALQKARDAGALSNDEFDQYDAQLVLCIE